MKILFFLLISFNSFAQSAVSIDMYVNCKFTYIDKFETDKSKEKKQKMIKVKLTGHFDQPEQKCRDACSEHMCELIDFSI